MKNKIIIGIIIAIALISASFTAGYFISKTEQTNTSLKEETKDEKNKEYKKEEETKEEQENNKEKEEQPDSSENEPEEEKLIPDSVSIVFEEEKYVTKNKKGTKLSENIRTIPKITFSSNQKAADKIAKSLKEISDEEWTNNIKVAADDLKENEIYENVEEYEGLGATLYFNNDPNITRIMTFTLTLSGGFGGVGWYSYWGYSYDVTTGELLTLKTLTDNYSKFEETLISQVKQELEKLKSEVEIYELSDQQIIDYINQTGNWIFTEDGITIIFQEYEIADGATGAISIDIDKSIINKHLKKEYKYY